MTYSYQMFVDYRFGPILPKMQKALENLANRNMCKIFVCDAIPGLLGSVPHGFILLNTQSKVPEPPSSQTNWVPLFISSNRVCIQKEYPNDVEQTVKNLVYVLNQLSPTQAFYSQITPHNDQTITLWVPSDDDLPPLKLPDNK